MTTVAPRFANATAHARPMPRAPPVTSTTLSLKSLISSRRLFERSHVLDVHALDALGDALDEAAEHLAGTELDDLGNALALERLHALDPPHAAGHLLEQQV